MTAERLIRGRWVITGPEAEDPIIEDGALALAGGEIADVGTFAELRAHYPEAAVEGDGSQALIPGMINAHHHCHGASSLQHGIADDLLEPWILDFHAMRATDPYLETALSAARQLRTGVTAVVDVVSGGGSASGYDANLRARLKAHREAGLRVAFASGISDQSHLVHGAGADQAFIDSLPAEAQGAARALMPGPGQLDQDDYFAILGALRDEARADPLIDIWLGPPGPQWVSDPFWERIGSTAEAWDCGIQTHLNESFYEKLHAPLDYGRESVAHLQALGLLGPRLSLAHGVWLSEAEISLLAESGTAVSHNPSSNLRLRAGIAPLNTLLAAQVTTGLGMDGTTLDDDEDLFTELRLALRLHRTTQLGGPAPSVSDIWSLATTGGARLLRRESQLGRLAPGFQADVVSVRLDRIAWPWVAPETDPRALVLWRAKAGDVERVLIAGREVLADGRPTGLDLDALAAALTDHMARAGDLTEAAARVALVRPHLEAHYRAWDLPALVPYSIYNSRR